MKQLQLQRRRLAFKNSKNGQTAAIAAVILCLFGLFLHRTIYMGIGDFEAYHNAASRWWQGQPLYIAEATPFKYLPGSLIVFLPFAFFPAALAKLLFYCVSFSAAAAFYLWTARTCGWKVAAITLAITLRFHNVDFNIAQVNGLLLGIWAGVQWSLQSGHPGRAASLLAFIASFKVLPLAGLPAFALFRQWRALGLACLSFFGLSALVLLSTPQGLHGLLDWYSLMRATTELPAPDSAIIQSVQAALWFLCRSLGTPGAFYPALVLFSGAFIGSLGWRLLSSHRQKNLSLLLLLELGLALTVVFSPLAWKHGYVLLAPLVARLAQTRGAMFTAVFALPLVILPALLALIFGTEIGDRSYLTLIGALALIWQCSALAPRSQQRPLKLKA